MSTKSTPRSIQFLHSISPELWVVSIAFFGIGDVVTTHVGLQFDHIAEVGPVAAPIITEFGFLGMVGMKGFVFVLASTLFVLVPNPHNIGVPLGLAVLGVLVTGWNAFLLAGVFLIA